ncbi:diguanylate cyclase domain-containing protein [Dechloromonas sp. ARDL1]|uniref:diguanylate cyclase domain-containing protein n=1 Tax=Dechloromonas sp. ARDL1 TaxID=3322121 RepID=UPI003DA7401D
MRFSCLSLRKRLFIAVAPGLILLAVVVALAYQGFQSISHSTSMLVDRQARQAFLAERANEHTLQAAHHLLRLLLTQERKSRVPLYAAMDAALNTADQALLQLVNAEGESATANISRLQTLRQAYGVAFQETVEQIELGGPISAIHHFERQTEPLLRELLSATAEFSIAQQDAMQSEVDRLTAEAARDQANIIAIGLLALLLGALVSGLLATGIARPVNQAAEIAEKIAGGDYSIPIAAPGHDELSSMLRAIDTMRLRIGEREAHIRRIAYVDELTDLANRARFVEDFATRHWRGGAMLILDIDRFTMINQALGHAIGDELLRAVARRLQAVLAEHDLLARLWGDEFAMLLCGADIDSAMATANRIRDVLREPIEIAGQSIDLDASIGVVRIP